MSPQEKEDEDTRNAPFCVLDGLYCEEESGFVEDLVVGTDGDGDLWDKSDEFSQKSPFFTLILPEQDMFWDDDELLSLASKENETKPCFCDKILDEFLVLCRKEALDWIFRVKSHYGLSSLTALLAVNYFDRFITSIKFQTEKPWMSQLAAVACLSLAAKVEEIQVPLLLDLQVEEARYVFEAKTIQRMELLVLSTLQWRMHPVTPISFFDHIIRRFGSKSHHHWEFMRRCERLLLSVIVDSRFMSYTPSVLATAIMIYVMKEFKPCDEAEYQSQLMNLLKVSQEKANECYELLLEINGSQNMGKRRSNLRVPASPTGVFEAAFSSDSSNDSWVVSATSVSEPLLKRRRVQEQQMRLPPSVNRLFLDVLSSPRWYCSPIEWTGIIQSLYSCSLSAS
ncbi:PREDICTED: LOW QUALITY PROTEIN: cyclin-D3-2 [Tarenaya hassleriana]|uniref:LOW QUALITY PROTEIN: cyclin-D3-2 n=1 Tax=Tarenaya hassleriana TaxID=28532 RepID=UPI0008FCE9D6|nr:PREDICTED: LOW QUALITY PROTEIN: cyclin-D3-2 [Tarenaya hassleriana]